MYIFIYIYILADCYFSFFLCFQPTALAASRSAALCVFDDVIEHCSADGASTRYIDVSQT